MHGWGLFFFLLFLLLVILGAAWIAYTQIRARRAGLVPPTWRSYVPFMKDGSGGSSSNYPTPRSAGPLEWIREQAAKITGGSGGGGRTARGAYEEAGGVPGGAGGYAGVGQPRGRGRGMEDDAWDTRVGGREEYGYEEQELGLAPTPGLASEPYGAGSDYVSGGGGGAARGGYADESGRGARGLAGDPFGDQHEAPSLRSVSPRPHEGDARGHKGNDSLDSADGSPSSTRKSAFREGI